MIDVSGFTGPDDGRKIFAVRGLPPEVIATLFAFYSRRAGDLQDLARQLTPILGEDLFRYVRVDTNEYEFARDEKRSEVKS